MKIIARLYSKAHYKINGRTFVRLAIEQKDSGNQIKSHENGFLEVWPRFRDLIFEAIGDADAFDYRPPSFNVPIGVFTDTGGAVIVKPYYNGQQREIEITLRSPSDLPPTAIEKLFETTPKQEKKETIK